MHSHAPSNAIVVTKIGMRILDWQPKKDFYWVSIENVRAAKMLVPTLSWFICQRWQYYMLKELHDFATRKPLERSLLWMKWHEDSQLAHKKGCIFIIVVWLRWLPQFRVIKTVAPNTCWGCFVCHVKNQNWALELHLFANSSTLMPKKCNCCGSYRHDNSRLIPKQRELPLTPFFWVLIENACGCNACPDTPWVFWAKYYRFWPIPCTLMPQKMRLLWLILAWRLWIGTPFLGANSKCLRGWNACPHTNMFGVIWQCFKRRDCKVLPLLGTRSPKEAIGVMEIVIRTFN